MGRPVRFIWPSASTTSVTTLQTLVAAGSLTIDGSLSIYTRPDSSLKFVDLGGIQRTVSLTSTNNLSGVNFTITGTLNGSVVSETRVGPNNNTVETTQLFNTITSISTSAAAAAVSVGTGFTGATNLYTYDYHVPNSVLGIEVDVTNGSGAITYSFECTLDDANRFTPTFFSPIAAMTAATTDQMANTTQPMAFARIKVTASSGTASLTSTFIQQGLRS